MTDRGSVPRPRSGPPTTVERAGPGAGPATDGLETLVRRLVAADGPADGLAEQIGSLPHPDAAAWEGIAQLGAGDPDGAARRLRAWPRDRGSSQRLGALVDAALVLAEGDVVTLARHLLERHGSRWPRFSPMDPDQLVERIARTHPTLVVDLLVDVPGVPSAPAVRGTVLRVLTELAEGSAHCGLAMGCLRVAQRLVSEVD